MKIKRLVTEEVEISVAPCPFCGSKNADIAWSIKGKCIYCLDCFAQGPSHTAGVEEEVIVESWNRRLGHD